MWCCRLARNIDLPAATSMCPSQNHRSSSRKQTHGERITREDPLPSGGACWSSVEQAFEDLPARDIVTNAGIEPHLRPHLAEDELLVRDGAGKMLAFSLVWTLAQYHQCERELNAGLRAVAEGAIQRIKARCKGKGLMGRSDVGPSGSNRGAKDILGCCAIIVQHHLEDRAKQARSLPELVDMLVAGQSKKAHVDGNLPVTLLGDLLISQTWCRVNNMKWSDSPKASRYSETEAQFGHLSMFGHRAAVARIFYGARNSIERTTNSRYRDEPSLDRFLDDEPDAGLPATPVPVPLLKRWSRILGFSETDPRDSSGAAVWRDLCGPEDGLLCGADLATFAASLERFLKSPPTAVHEGFEKVDVGKKASDAEAVGQSRKRERGKVTTGDRVPIAARGQILKGVGPTPTDFIEMRMGDTPERVTLEGIRYALDEPGPADAPRACLSAVDIVWKWERGDLVTVIHTMKDRAQGLDLLERENRDLAIVDFALQDTSLRITVRAEDGAALAPKHSQAIDRFVMPQADIKPLPGCRHVFTLEASRKSLCVARFDSAIGRMRVVADHDGKQLTQDESLRLILPLAFTELSKEFPGFPFMKELGKREYEVAAVEGSS